MRHLVVRPASTARAGRCHAVAAIPGHSLGMNGSPQGETFTLPLSDKWHHCTSLTGPFFGLAKKAETLHGSTTEYSRDVIRIESNPFACEPFQPTNFRESETSSSWLDHSQVPHAEERSAQDENRGSPKNPSAARPVWSTQKCITYTRDGPQVTASTAYHQLTAHAHFHVLGHIAMD